MNMVSHQGHHSNFDLILKNIFLYDKPVVEKGGLQLKRSRSTLVEES